MEHVQGWNESCQHGNVATSCEICIGALHPTLNAITRHLAELLDGRNPVTATKNAGEIFQLIMTTDSDFLRMKGAQQALHTEEGKEPTTESSKQERHMLSEIIDITTRLLERFEVVFPDIRDHFVTTGIRSEMNTDAL